MLTSDQIDETLMMFDDLDIEVLPEGEGAVTKSAKKAKPKKVTKTIASAADFGAVTDPVKMYLREMGLLTHNRLVIPAIRAAHIFTCLGSRLDWYNNHRLSPSGIDPYDVLMLSFGAHSYHQ